MGIGRCYQFEGGSCDNELFTPIRFQGLRVKARDNYSSDEDLLKDLFVTREARFTVPDTSLPGECVEAQAFGNTYKVPVPAEAVPGKSQILLRLREGNVQALLE